MKKVKPQIAKRVALDEVGLSHRKLEQGQVRGTVVCLPWKRVSRRNIQQMDEDKETKKESSRKKKDGKKKQTESAAKEESSDKNESKAKKNSVKKESLKQNALRKE